ncbi:serine/threonine-protein kinase pim-2-like [Paralichthys olivaceus]|uniref:serine/threonine-protein kinase pim-2-like n=1 Tax=Paralichthys olivaceus TaxID=8255 RepID=UPI00097CE63B|nr:PREDICTED: serine/threonine-protein kinase pim-2-like [Paralichthys olivaceus]
MDFQLSCPTIQAGRIKSGMTEKRKKKWDSIVDNKESVSLSLVRAITRVNQRANFKAKYQVLNQLCKGGCGSVFAGYRKADHLQVAIKRVPQLNLKQVSLDGKKLPAEVAIMLKLAAEKDGSVGMAAPVELLDWYDLGHELILVQERPLNAMDLFQYIEDKGSVQQEEARDIIKQLVDALIALQERQIFHQDIKLENILIVTGSTVPQVRLIDFGLSVIGKKDSVYRTFCGTREYIPPEWYNSSTYTAGPATVWQLGIVLFEMLHICDRFSTKRFQKKVQRISCRLSETCRNFLQLCLKMDPDVRATLTELQLHPWLGVTAPPAEKI